MPIPNDRFFLYELFCWEAGLSRVQAYPVSERRDDVELQPGRTRKIDALLDVGVAQPKFTAGSAVTGYLRYGADLSHVG